MPLGLGLGLGLQKPTPPPVSAWPTVADIPQGAVVLDTDGVVKQCRYVFNNAGTDLINCGRPANLIALLDPTVASSVCLVVQPSATGGGYVHSLGDATTLQSSLSILAGGVAGGIGGGGTYCSPAIAKTTNVMTCTLFTDGATFAKVSSGGVVSSVSRGTTTSPGPLIFGARDGIGTNNFDGYTFSASFYAGYNAGGSCTGLQLVDRYDFNKWDGSASGLSDMGNPYSVTKASPFTELVKALVPVSLL